MGDGVGGGRPPGGFAVFFVRGEQHAGRDLRLFRDGVGHPGGLGQRLGGTGGLGGVRRLCRRRGFGGGGRSGTFPGVGRRPPQRGFVLGHVDQGGVGVGAIVLAGHGQRPRHAAFLGGGMARFLFGVGTGGGGGGGGGGGRRRGRRSRFDGVATVATAGTASVFAFPTVRRVLVQTVVRLRVHFLLLQQGVVVGHFGRGLLGASPVICLKTFAGARDAPLPRTRDAHLLLAALLLVLQGLLVRLGVLLLLACPGQTVRPALCRLWPLVQITAVPRRTVAVGTAGISSLVRVAVGMPSTAVAAVGVGAFGVGTTVRPPPGGDQQFCHVLRSVIGRGRTSGTGTGIVGIAPGGTRAPAVGRGVGTRGAGVLDMVVRSHGGGGSAVWDVGAVVGPIPQRFMQKFDDFEIRG